MKHLLTILLFLCSTVLYSQGGGRMKERSNQKKLVRHIFKSGWQYKPTKPGKIQNYWREGRYLFKGNVTSNKKFKRKLQGKINRERARKRVRGNMVFSKKKYNRA